MTSPVGWNNTTMQPEVAPGQRHPGQEIAYVLEGTLEYEGVWRVSGDGVPPARRPAREIAPAPGLPGGMDRLHVRNWLECVRAGRRATNCTAEHGTASGGDRHRTP